MLVEAALPVGEECARVLDTRDAVRDRRDVDDARLGRDELRLEQPRERVGPEVVDLREHADALLGEALLRVAEARVVDLTRWC